MGSRNIVIPIDLTKTGGVIIPTEGKVVYTNETVNLTFNITGITDYTGVNAAVALVMADGSVFQREKPLTATPAVFLLQENEVQHAGMVTGQIKITDAEGTVTSQEFIFSIKAFILDAYETLQVIREIEVDNFELLKEQVEGIQAAVVANWDTVQANLDTMEATYASDWSAWFTTNTNSITAEWITLKGEINAKQATFAQDIATVEADEAARVTAESGRATAEGIRTTSESGRGEEEASRVIAETGRVGAESTRVTNENTRKASEVTRVASESARTTAETARVASENTRVSSENTRISQENARKTAETARVGIASTDHTTAQGDHSTALTDHTTATADHGTAVTDHTTNLADHAIVGGYNTRLTTVESDTVVSATNLVTNGDFINGTTGWLVSGGTIASDSVVFLSSPNSVMVSVPAKQWVRCYQAETVTIGNKYYISTFLKSTAVTGGLRFAYAYGELGNYPSGFLVNSTDAISWKRFSSVFSPTATNLVFGVTAYMSSGQSINLDNLSLIDLTATFGAGNEPTVEQMDKILAQFPNSWFNATENLFLAKQVLDRVNELDTRTEMVAQNLVVNGDFSNGTTGWTTATYGTLSASNNILTVTATDTLYSLISQNGKYFNLNDKIYIRAKAKNTTGGVKLSLCSDLAGSTVSNVSNVSANTWYTLSGTYNGSGGNQGIRVDKSGATEIGDTLQIQNTLLINLTATFGAGKEPTLAEMDRLMTHFPNSWFDGKQPLNTIRNLYTDKANKVQEAWITPTLLNGWVAQDAIAYPVAYRKDEFGKVYFKGRIMAGTGTTIFTLPVGYRPVSANLKIPCSSVVNTFLSVTVAGTGLVTTASTNTDFYLDSIEFPTN